MTKLQKIAAEIKIYDKCADFLRGQVAEMKRERAITVDGYNAVCEMRLVRDHTIVEHIKAAATRDVASAEATLREFWGSEENAA